MNLSSELISQFAKINNDTGSNKSEEVTLYGTIVQSNDELYVKLDGSNELTPMLKTVTVKVGERVSVVIKNHSAIVTGNLSDPSASSNDLSDLANKVIEATESITLIVGNQEEFSEFKQTVEGFSFMSKGGSVKISGGDIELTGAITWEDLDEDMQTVVDNIDTKADNAQSTADSALSSANSANSLASSAYSIATSITVPDYLKSTYIDSTTIKSPYIYGNDISVYGTFQTIGDGYRVTGYMGAAKGQKNTDYGPQDTYGVAMASSWNADSYAVSDYYVIVTDAGVRLQAGSNRLVVSDGGIWLSVDNGAAYYNGVEIGGGQAVFG